MTTLTGGTTTRSTLPSRCVLGMALALAVLLVVACKNEDITGGIRPGTVFVAVRDTFFTPDTVTIGAGFPVRWTIEGNLYHTVVSDSALWASELLGRNSWFEVTFDSAGEYPYHCSQHTGMTGAVIVTP